MIESCTESDLIMMRQVEKNEAVELFNMSISTGKFPSEWKVGTIVPIPKGKQSDKLTNYRPISVQPTISKVIEKHVKNQTGGTPTSTCSNITATMGVHACPLVRLCQL